MTQRHHGLKNMELAQRKGQTDRFCSPADPLQSHKVTLWRLPRRFPNAAIPPAVKGMNLESPLKTPIGMCLRVTPRSWMQGEQLQLNSV